MSLTTFHGTEVNIAPVLTAGLNPLLLNIIKEWGMGVTGTVLMSPGDSNTYVLWHGCTPNNHNEIPVVAYVAGEDPTTTSPRWFCGVAPYISEANPAGDNNELTEVYLAHALSPVKTRQAAIAGAFVLTYGIHSHSEEGLLDFLHSDPS